MLSNTIFEFIRQYGIKSVILGGLIEQVIVPIPSPLVPMAAGFLFVDQAISNYPVAFKEIFLKAALPFAVGSTLGSTMVYLVSWFGGKWLIDKFSKWLGFDWADIEGIQKKYFKGKSTDELLIFVFRAIPMVPSSLISAVCGTIRIKPFSFYFYTFLGLLFRGIILGFVGWQSGEAIFKISNGLDKTEMIISVLMLLLFIAAFFFAYAKRKKWLKSIKE